MVFKLQIRINKINVMNKNIENYLDTYMVNPDPRYAVMLKGKWGCGKTYFITNWLKKYKEKEITGMAD